MAFQKNQPKGKPKVVKKRLADGTIREYSYQRAPVTHTPKAADSLSALIEAWQRSPEFARVSEGRKRVCAIYLRHIASLGSVKAANLKRRDIRTIRDAIAAEGHPGAANAFVGVVSAMCAWAIKADWIEHNPATGIENIPGGHLPAWSQDQADKAIAELPPHLSRLVLAALYLGQRRGDLCRLAWSNYDGQRIKLVQGKTGAPLTIPVHPVLKVAMDAWPRTQATILTNSDGNPWKPGTVTVALDRALPRLGFPVGHGIHGVRKLAAANLAEAGCTAHEIGAITGHVTLSMLELYTKSADQERMATAAIYRLTMPKRKP
jgi:integrase